MPRYTVVECEECLRSFLGTLPDWLTFGATAAAVWVAWRALGTWQEQVKGQTRHAVSLEIREKAQALRYALYSARYQFIANREFPPPQMKNVPGGDSIIKHAADTYDYVYSGRFRALWPYAQACLDLRPRAGAVFGDDCADAIKNLADVVYDLSTAIEAFVYQVRAGREVVKSWPDQESVEYAKNAVQAPAARDDRYSLQFEEAMERVFKTVGEAYPPPKVA